MEKIGILRKKIDDLDLKLLKLLSKRRNLALRIGKIKSTHGLHIRDKKREMQILKSRLKIAKNLKFPKNLVKALFKVILSDSRQYQKTDAMSLTRRAKIDKIYR